MAYRRRIDAAFFAWGTRIQRFRWASLLSSLVVAILLAAQIPDLRIDTSTESLLRPDSLPHVEYLDYKRTFERDDLVVVGIQSDGIYDVRFLQRLLRLQAAIEAEVPYVDEVTSLRNARYTRSEGDELIVEDLMEGWSGSAADVLRVAERVRRSPPLVGSLVSVDETLTTISLKPYVFSATADADPLTGFEQTGAAGPGNQAEALLSEAEMGELLARLREVLSRFDAPDFRLYLVGDPVVSETVSAMLERDLLAFTLSTLGVVALILAAIFRRGILVVIPLLVVLLAALESLGVMVLIGVPLSVPSQILPSFLIAVGICSSVHLLVAYDRFAGLEGFGEAAIPRTLEESGFPVAIAALTTAGALASFVTADIEPIAELGLVAPIGVLISLLQTLVLLPALLALAPPKRSSLEASRRIPARIGILVARAGDFASRHPRGVLVVLAALLGVGAFGVAQVRFGQSSLHWLPADHPLRVATEQLDRKLGGFLSLEVIVDTKGPNGLYEPENLARIEEFASRVLALDGGVRPVGVFSILDILREVHRALYGMREDHYTIPSSRAAVAQELLLFEGSGSDDLAELADGNLQRARVSFRVPWVDYVLYPPLIASIQSIASDVLGKRMRARVTGLVAVFATAYGGALSSMATSYLLAGVVIVPLMALLLGSVRSGLISMLPNLLPVYATLALMGWVGIPLDIATLLIGSIVLGLAVDDTIHLFSGYSRQRSLGKKPREAVYRTLETTGSAMLVTTLVLGAGFGCFLLSTLTNMQHFGLLSAFAIIVAFLADLFVGPALLILWGGRSSAEAAPERDLRRRIP